MDIIILFVLFLTGLAVWRDAPRWLVITGWTVALVLMIGLFRYHVSSSLGLSF